MRIEYKDYLIRKDAFAQNALSETKYQRSVLMTVSMAAIGFAFHNTASWPFDWRLMLVLISIALWGLSFVLGLKVSKSLSEAAELDIKQFDEIFNI